MTAVKENAAPGANGNGVQKLTSAEKKTVARATPNVNRQSDRWKGLNAALANYECPKLTQNADPRFRFTDHQLNTLSSHVLERMLKSDPRPTLNHEREPQPGRAWKSEHVEDILDLSRRLSLDLVNLTRVLERKVSAPFAVRTWLYETTGIPTKVWRNFKLSTHPVYLYNSLWPVDDPSEEGLVAPVATSAWAESFWQPKRIRDVGTCADITPQLLWHVIRRRLGVRDRETAELLCMNSEDKIPVSAWLSNRTTRHPAFIGQPARIL